MKTLHEIRDALSSWSATALLLALYATTLAAATFIEAALGTEAARSAIYHAWWMYLLYGAMGLNFWWLAQRLQLGKRHRWGTLLLHGGFLLILLGAAITHLWGYEGTLHLREGETSNQLKISHTDRRTLPFQVTLRDFQLKRYPGSLTPSSYESEVTIQTPQGQRNVRIFMNHIARINGFRLYQASYDPDERGTILSVNYDPIGTPVTYTGYFMVIAGLVIALGQKGSRFRQLFALLDAQPTAQPT